MERPQHMRTDPLRLAVEAHGIETTDQYLFGHPGSEYIGPKFRIQNCEMVYRLAEADLLMIVLFRRLARSPSIRNPFAELLWFILLATEPRFGIRRIMGSIETFEYAHENGLSNERLTRFYERFFAAQTTRYDGSIWLYRDIDDSVRVMLARARHKAIRVNPPSVSGHAGKTRFGALDSRRDRTGRPGAVSSATEIPNSSRVCN